MTTPTFRTQEDVFEHATALAKRRQAEDPKLAKLKLEAVRGNIWMENPDLREAFATLPSREAPPGAGVPQRPVEKGAAQRDKLEDAARLMYPTLFAEGKRATAMRKAAEARPDLRDDDYRVSRAD